MGILSNIIGAIFGSKADAKPAQPASGQSAGSASSGGTGSSDRSAQSTASGNAPAAGTGSSQQVDVAAVLDKAVAAKKQKLEWRTSIVDLMKALDLDSSLSARKELAKELNYDGDMNDSAKMNMWLHKQVIQKLRENGGKVPADLKD